MKPVTPTAVCSTCRDVFDVRGMFAGWRGLLCPRCSARAESWRKYNARQAERKAYEARATCEHGIFVGGCGRDIACSRCEAGQ